MNKNITNEKFIPFERIRRITGYLVGTLDRFNDAKREEESNRVKHTSGLYVDLSKYKNKNYIEPCIKCAGIVEDSSVDGPGIRMAIFSQGCNKNCFNCHNKHTQDYNAGINVPISEIMNLIINNKLYDGVTFTGGEPFDQAKNFVILAKKIKDIGLNIITYTGYTYDEIVSFNNKNMTDLLNITDVLIDGPYIDSLKDLKLAWRGSSNQKIYNFTKVINM